MAPFLPDAYVSLELHRKKKQLAGSHLTRYSIACVYGVMIVVVRVGHWPRCRQKVWVSRERFGTGQSTADYRQLLSLRVYVLPYRQCINRASMQGIYPSRACYAAMWLGWNGPLNKRHPLAMLLTPPYILLHSCGRISLDAYTCKRLRMPRLGSVRTGIARRTHRSLVEMRKVRPTFELSLRGFGSAYAVGMSCCIFQKIAGS
ncbi:hypothetical protein FVE85_3836 [Porphyridium purpureum]|uniref:Uncharacterized protein n=1 Tax=Porphyridium purpureum TaxID=35688 RepID=A0A5J4YJN8_PORPP|nr:hypothetical protein FVE85_3836 [Porphyridium purpureum]|eukprot:POR9715..scf243_20